MQLQVYMNDMIETIDVPPELLQEAQDFFAKMDADMDKGYQMSRSWVDHPNIEQRCQIVANRLLTALSNGRQTISMMMAAYILSRLPTIKAIYLNTEGDMTEHDLVKTTDDSITNG